MPNAIKKCNVEPYAECNTKKYLEKIRYLCKCVLWALKKVQQVGYKTYGVISTTQDLPFCTPAASPCISSVPVTSDECRVTCTGLYADVTVTVEDNSIQRLTEGGRTIKLHFVSVLVSHVYGAEKLRDLLKANGTGGDLKLMEAYKAYKTNYLRNMVFDPSTPGLSMLQY